MSIGDQGGEAWGRKFAFSLIRNPKDKLVLCLPEMAAAQAERENEDNRQGWLYLHDFVDKWLSRRAWVMSDDKFDNGGQEPIFIDWDWLMKYQRFSGAVDELTTEQYLTEPAARKRLTEILEEDGAFAGEGTPFDHTVLPWDKLRKHAFHGKSVPYGANMLAPDLKTPDGFAAAIGNLTVYALAVGETRVKPDGTRWIIIRKIGWFIHDGFDFNGEQWLGNWECSPKYKGFNSMDTALELPFDRPGKEIGLASRLDNRDLRRFRERTGYGCDFRVMSFSFARRAFAIFYMVLPFLVFFLFVFIYWRNPDPALTNPASPKFNEFAKPVDWTLAYSFWEMLPTLPLLIWPIPIALWLYRKQPTLFKGTCVAMSFLAFLIISFYCCAGLASMLSLGRR